MTTDMPALLTSPVLWLYSVVMLALSGGIASYAAEKGKNRAAAEDARRLQLVRLEFDQLLEDYKAELDKRLERAKRISDIHVKKDYEFLESIYSDILKAKYAFAQIRPIEAPMNDVEFVCHIGEVTLRGDDDPDRGGPYLPTSSCKEERLRALELAQDMNSPYIESVMSRRPFIPSHIYDEIVAFWKLGTDSASAIRYPGFNRQPATPEQFEEKVSTISRLISEHFGLSGSTSAAACRNCD